MTKPTSLGSRVVPALLTQNRAETLAFYRKLGFTVSRALPNQEVATWLEVRRDNVVLQFHTDSPKGTPDVPACTGTFYFFPKSVLDLFEELRDKVEVLWGPEVMDYGMREFGIRDPNGYYLAFAKPA